jgi:hypothetical protein
MPNHGLALKPIPQPSPDSHIDLDSPGEQQSIARGFRWYAGALETAVQDGLFLAKHPDTVFLLDQDILRAHLAPGDLPEHVSGLISAFLKHPQVKYAIPPGSFLELVDTGGQNELRNTPGQRFEKSTW